MQQKVLRFIWTTALMLVLMLSALCLIFLSGDKRSSQLVGVPMAGLGGVLMAPELIGVKTISKWQKSIRGLAMRLEERARAPLAWSVFLNRWKNIFVSQLRAGLIFVPVGVGYLIQGQWGVGLFLIVIGPLIGVAAMGPIAFGLHALWIVPVFFLVHRLGIFLLRSILNETLQQLKIKNRLRHTLMALGIAFIVVGTGLQFYAST